MEGPRGAPIPYFSMPILYYKVSFQLDHFQDFVLQIFLGEEFVQPKILLLKQGIFARNTALLGTRMYAAGADILNEFLVGLWL